MCGSFSGSATWTKDLTPDVAFYDVDIAYNDRGDVLRTVDNVLLDGSTHRFDRSFTLDDLGRLLGEERGDWTGSAIGTVREDRDRSLGLTGNRASRAADRDGDGSADVDDLNPLTGSGAHFTNANEWIARDTDADGTDDHTLTYDANGNLTDDGKDYTYIYDAWNRLVSISTTGGSPTLVAAYRYNGLGQRITEGD